MTFKHILFLSGIIFITITAYGQQLSFKDKQIDTLKIASNISGYHFDSAGTTTGTYDELTIYYNYLNKKYLSSYNRTFYTTIFEPDTHFVKIKQIWKDKSISQEKLFSLVKAFETSYRRPTPDNVGMTLKQLKKLANEEAVKRAAKQSGYAWRFDKKYSSLVKRDRIYEDCLHLDTFALYLNSAFDSSSYVYVTDYSNTLTVKLICDSLTFSFEGKYPKPYKQPWFNKTGEYHYWPRSILNFEINSTLISLLPKDFTNRKTIELSALIDDYLKWYLHRKDYVTFYP